MEGFLAVDAAKRPGQTGYDDPRLGVTEPKETGLERYWRVLLGLSLLLSSRPVFAAGGDDTGKDPLHGLEYRLIGPAAGGRVSRVAGVPGDPLTYNAATGEGQIGTMAVHPHNPDTAFAAVLGSPFGPGPEASGLVELGNTLVKKLDAVEEEIHNPHAEVNHDILADRQGGAKLYSRLNWMFMIAEDHDGPPTQGMRKVGAELGKALAVQEAALDKLVSGDLAALNAQAKELGVPYVVAPPGDN